MSLTVKSTLIADRPLAPLATESAYLGAIERYVRAGRCALFVGAGMSAGAGLPTWSELMRRVIERATPFAIDPATVPDRVSVVDDDREVFEDETVRLVRKELGTKRFRQLHLGFLPYRRSTADAVLSAIELVRDESDLRAELLALLAAGRYPELAGECRRIVGETRFSQWVQELLAPKRMPKTHADIVRTPFSAVVTTNFDDLLEKAYERWGECGVPPAPTGAELADHGTLLLDDAFFVLKAHGSALRPETMVFTTGDYQRVIHENDAFQAVLAGILLTNAILFVGYSLSDVNFRILMDRQLTTFRGQVPPRFAVMEDVGPAEAEILWHTARISVISYPKEDHEQVGQVLNQLAAAFPGPERGRARRNAAPALGPRRSVGRPKPVALTSVDIRAERDEISVQVVREGRPPVFASRTWPKWTSVGKKIRAALDELRRPSARRFETAGSALAASLPELALQRLEGIRRGEVVELRCSPTTSCLPWEWLPIGGEILSVRNPLVRGTCEVTASARGYRFLKRPLRALLVGDSGCGDGSGRMGLVGADREVEAVAAFLGARDDVESVAHLKPEEATAERFLGELLEGDYDVVHFAGHAECVGGESLLTMWDRVILGSELAPVLARRPPALLVMSTHFTAFQPYDLQAMVMDAASLDHAPGVRRPVMFPGGFSGMAMRSGVSSFVGCFGHPPDEGTADLILAFYRRLHRSPTVAHALQRARRAADEQAYRAGLMMTVSGHPDFGFRHAR